MRPLLAVPLLVLAGCMTSPKSGRGFHLPDGDRHAGRVAFVESGCSGCHEVSGDRELPPPTVEPPVLLMLGGERSVSPTDGQLATSIIDPDHHISGPFVASSTVAGGRSRMRDMTREMSVRQLIDIIAYLHSVYRVEGISGPPPGPGLRPSTPR